MGKKYKTFDGRGSKPARRKPKTKCPARRKPKTKRPAKKKLMGYDLKVVYAGISVKELHKIRGTKAYADAELKRLNAKYRADTSVAHVEVKKVY